LHRDLLSGFSAESSQGPLAPKFLHDSLKKNVTTFIAAMKQAASDCLHNRN
jgi:hypothetical protein